jgi:RNA polymerase sigma-70 factor (ECF subfamily)
MSEQLDQHIQACLDGEVDRFTEVVKSCEPRVRAVLAAMSPDPNVVPDLTQEVFLIAYERLDSYQPGSNFLAWIRTIARNVAQNERRRWYRRQAMREQYQSEAERLMSENIDRLVESLPEETLDALRACVGGLGGRNKDLVDHYYFKGNALKRIAVFLNMSPTAAKVALHRARVAIGKCLRGKGAA